MDFRKSDEGGTNREWCARAVKAYYGITNIHYIILLKCKLEKAIKFT